MGGNAVKRTVLTFCGLGFFQLLKKQTGVENINTVDVSSLVGHTPLVYGDGWGLPRTPTILDDVTMHRREIASI